MEIKHTNIHMNRVCYRNAYRMTVNEDVNVSDQKQDVFQVVFKTCGVRMGEKKLAGGKFYLKGSIPYCVLYLSEGDTHEVQSIQGELPFEEIFDAPTDCPGDNLSVRVEVEEFETHVVHSRKLSFKAVLGVMIVAEEMTDLFAAEPPEEDEKIHTRMRSLKLSSLAADKKDILRLREEVFLPSGKESVDELLFPEVKLRNAEVRTKDGGLEIKGELALFVLWKKESGGTDFLETSLPFRDELKINGCMEGMIEDTQLHLTKETVSVKSDEDGENRLFEIEGVLEIEVKLYEEKEVPILSDLYATDCILTPIRETASYENLLMKNDSRMRMTERIAVPGTMPEMLQLCHGKAELLPDVCERDGETLKLSGVIAADILYITEEDEKTLQCFSAEIPFTHTLEVRGLTQQSTYDIHCNITDISFSMTRNGEIEMKAELAFCVVAMENCVEQMITDTTRTEFEEGRLEKLPSMIGHPVRAGESLWDIAKHYCVAEEKILSLTEHSGEPKEGDMLLIVKSAMC